VQVVIKRRLPQIVQFLTDPTSAVASMPAAAAPALPATPHGDAMTAKAAALAAGGSAVGGGSDGSDASSAPVRSSRMSLQDWEVEMLLNVAVYERLVAALDLNSVEYELDSPLRDYLKTVA